MKALIIITTICAYLTNVAVCQTLEENEGSKTIKIISIDKYKLPYHYRIQAVDSSSHKELTILSNKIDNASCGANNGLAELKTGEYYHVNLKVFPMFPFTMPKDSLNVFFDSRPVQANFHGIIFTEDNLPYTCEEIIKDKICKSIN